MSEILQNTGVTLWSIRDDYDELQTSVFEALTGTGGKSNIRLIDEAIGNINSKLNGYYFEYSDDRLYICKKSEDENIKRYPVTLNDNNGHIASKVDGSTITIDENGIVRGLPVDDALSSISTNPIQNKVVKAKVDEIEKNVSKNTENIKKNDTNISNNTQKITSLETAVSSEKTRAEGVENQLKTDLENGKKVWDDKYTKSEVDNKLSTLETNIDWKEAVSTFDDIATTYPTPGDGWTVNVKDTDYTYRYNGTKWVAISANAIPKATNKVDGLMTKEYAKKLDGLTKYTPDGTTITADEDGTLHGADTIQVDGITITRDDATKVIALAKTLQDKIGTIDNKVDQNYVVNNLTTTEQGFVLDGRQGKALQDQITSLNGSLKIKKYYGELTANSGLVEFRDQLLVYNSIYIFGKMVMISFSVLFKINISNVTIANFYRIVTLPASLQGKIEWNNLCGSFANSRDCPFVFSDGGNDIIMALAGGSVSAGDELRVFGIGFLKS